MAEKSPIGAHKLIFLPYLMGERTPHLDADARGVFFGISAMHTKGDFIRAVMEGVSYSLNDCLCVFSEMGISHSSMLVCGGGASSRLWRQMLSDVYACPVSVTASREGPALGAAILAMVGAGIYSSVQEACASVVKRASTHEYDRCAHEKYKKYYSIYKSLYPSLKSAYAALGETEE